MKAFMRLYLLCIVFTLNVAWSASTASGKTQPPPNVLQFVAMGDWGKGGVSGDILSVGTENLEVNKGVGVLKSSDSRLRGYDNRDEGHDGEDKERDDRDHDEHDHDEHDHEHDEPGGRQEYTYQVAVAGGMSSFINSSEINTTCIIALGDNFYDDGVLTANDSMWTTHWEQVYLQNYSNMRIPWYPVFGNHDYGYGDIGAAAQLERARYDRKGAEGSHGELSAGLWQFDSYNYTNCMTLPGTVNDTICLIFIDTTTLAPSEERNCNEEGGISTETQTARIADQQHHIEQMLIAATNSTWVIVCGHYPVYTSGEHGDSSELISNLQPLLEKYNVSMYLAGHDHLSGHLQHKGIEYFIAGGGAMVDPMGDVASAATDVWYGVGYAAFSVLRVTAATLEIKFIHWNGTEMYNYTLNNPRRNATFAAPAPAPAPRPGPGPEKSPFDGSNTFVVPDISPPLMYLALATGSITGVLLSLTIYTFRKGKTKGKGWGVKKSQRRSKEYSSVPVSPQHSSTAEQGGATATQSELLSLPPDDILSPGAASFYSPKQARSAPRPAAELNNAMFYPHSVHPLQHKRGLTIFNPFQGSRRGAGGDKLLQKLSAVASKVKEDESGRIGFVDHRKTMSSPQVHKV